jgi:choline transport protein
MILVHNIFAQVRTSWVHDVGCMYLDVWFATVVLILAVILTLTSFVVITVTCLARTPSFASSEFVWTNFVNNSGWSSNGVVFLTGMANPNFIYAGIDGAVHLAEEVTDATRTVPRALMSTIVIGFVTAFSFAVAMLYSMTDLTEVIKSATG